jgi:hypothetical protein
MFCPKCGIQNPETGKFCRSCGTNLGNVSAVLSGNLPQAVHDPAVLNPHQTEKRRKDPSDVCGESTRNIILGIGFFIISIILLVTNVANGRGWWWAMLFPAFGLLSSGISEYLKYKRMTNSAVNFRSQNQPSLEQAPVSPNLPPVQTEYVKPTEKSIYDTGELVASPGSVTENTTRHLEMNSEGETMTLPKPK